MSLTDEQIDRYSRQVILPEVGGRGQERLLAARVAIGGAGPALATAVTLLGRAGVGALDVSGPIGALPEISPDCRVRRDPDEDDAPAPDASVAVMDLSVSSEFGAVRGVLCEFGTSTPVIQGAAAGASLWVATLIGRSCLGCFGESWPMPDDVPGAEPLIAAASFALGALVASEVLRVLLSPPTRSRLTRLDLGRGTAVSKEIEPSGGCTLCGASA